MEDKQVAELVNFLIDVEQAFIAFAIIFDQLSTAGAELTHETIDRLTQLAHLAREYESLAAQMRVSVMTRPPENLM